MNKKTVFLLGDIGKDKHGLYHVGDEAMFLSNLESYQKLHINVFASSRSISHKDLLKNEVLDIYITNLFQFLILTSKSLLLRYLSVNTFPVFFRNTIKALTTADVLHISGGGNITSLWSGHIYYRSFMIFLAKLYDKKVILTGQTIGPINKANHKILLHNILNTVNYIGIRDKNFSRKTLENLRVKQKIIHFNYDDALFWKSKSKNNFQKNKSSTINIGISLHDSKDEKITTEIRSFIEKLTNESPNIKIYLIPHMLSTKSSHDIKYMKKLVKEIDIIKIIVVDYKFLLKDRSGLSIAEKIRGMVNKMDFVVTSRYHGLVFAISAKVPFLGINYDRDYCKGKNSGLIHEFDKKTENYVVDFESIKSDYILRKFNKLFGRRQVIKGELTKFMVRAYEENKETKNRIYRLERDAF